MPNLCLLGQGRVNVAEVIVRGPDPDLPQGHGITGGQGGRGLV